MVTNLGIKPSKGFCWYFGSGFKTSAGSATETKDWKCTFCLFIQLYYLEIKRNRGQVLLRHCHKAGRQEEKNQQ